MFVDEYWMNIGIGVRPVSDTITILIINISCYYRRVYFLLSLARLLVDQGAVVGVPHLEVDVLLQPLHAALVISFQHHL